MDNNTGRRRGGGAAGPRADEGGGQQRHQPLHARGALGGAAPGQGGTQTLMLCVGIRVWFPALCACVWEGAEGGYVDVWMLGRYYGRVRKDCKA